MVQEPGGDLWYKPSMVEPTPELIAVREDERFDETALVDWLDGRLPGSDGELTVFQFARGKANLTYLLRFGEQEYVLRRPPLGPLAPGSHDMSREFRVLSNLWRAFPQAARAYQLCEDSSVIGVPFFVMERRHGVVVQGVIPQIFGGGADVDANRRLSEAVIDTLAGFHAVDPAEAGLGDLGHPEGFLGRQVDGWIERWNRARHEDNPLADELGGWLRDHLPRSSQVSLLHNDWRLDNLAVSESDPGECVAVYDWDMCTRGDPLVDLGTVLAMWFDPGELPAGLVGMPSAVPHHQGGFMTRSQAIERYARMSGRDLTGLAWYQVFGAFKMAVILQQIFIRWHRGQTLDDRFAGMGRGAEVLLEVAATRRDGNISYR